MGLDEVLAQQTGGARFESSGRFSIDFLKARDKLERFRLPSPSHYLLKAVQAAVLAGATEINVKVLADATVFRFDVQPESEVARFEAVTLGLQNPFEKSPTRRCGRCVREYWGRCSIPTRPFAGG